MYDYTTDLKIPSQVDSERVLDENHSFFILGRDYDLCSEYKLYNDNT